MELIKVKKSTIFYVVRLFVICFSLFVLSFGVIRESYSGQTRGVTDDVLKVGMAIDQSGPACNVTIPLTNGVKRYFRYHNERGGINGRKVKVIVEDDRYSVPGGIAAFKKLLYKDKILALLGPTHSGAMAAVFDSIEKEKIITMSTAPNDTTVNPFRAHLFGVYETYPHMMKLLIDHVVKELKVDNPRIALVYPDNQAGKLDMASAIQRLKSYNLTPVSREVLNPGSIDATSQVLNMKRAKVTSAILCGFIPQPAGLLLRELNKFRFNIPVLGNVAAASEEVIHMAGKASKDYYAVSCFASWYDKGSGVELMRKITLKYAPGTEKPYRGKLYTFGWAISVFLGEGLKRAGRDIDNQKLLEALEGIRDFDPKGITGIMNCSSKSHKVLNTAKISKADPASGKFIPVTEWMRSN